MQIRNDFIETIGNTPLVKLRRASDLTGCTILGKAEFLNPGGSVKDRAAWASSKTPRTAARCNRAGLSLRALPATLALASLWSAMRAAIAPSS